MVVNNSKSNNTEPAFHTENNVLKGKVLSCESQYTNIGTFLFDKMKKNLNLVAQVDAMTGIEDTYADIIDRSVKCALWLQKHGVGKGDIVAVSSHNHRDCVVPCLAALYMGAIVNPWDYDMNVQLARHFLTLSKPKVIFANEKSVGIVLEAAKIELCQTEMVSFGDYPGTIPFSETLKGHSKSAVVNFRCKEINDRRDTGFILCSSGTTGLPKGTQLSHEVIMNMLALTENLDLNKQVPMWFSTLYWISGSMLTLRSIASGTKRIIAPDFDETIACEIIDKFKVTWLMLSTSMANRFVRFDRLHDYDLSSLTVLFTGGATLKQESQDLLKKHLPHSLIVQAYGMTELGGLVTAQLPDTTSGSCGVVCTNCEIKVIDTESGMALGPNQNGELCVKSWTMMTGYYKNPEETKKIIDKDGWLHTGDLGYYNEKEEFFIVDRLKEIIKYRGHQTTPNIIENLLQTHPAVLEVAVVGIPHRTDDEHPVAFVSKVPNKEVSAEELIKIVAGNLMDHYKLRGGVKFLPSLPHTHSGKISRKELRAMAKSLAVN
ncbi:PREDICTED: 4-coumarate--CoA ligase 1-like [Eufriesea mexicana]|uniref:4-coumarate--CoA ligase 1-like n=1 Tax=Eufriesea mexicana TaxID=516756 RepID=UPI00083C231C|nr:PREDICTED: 4-coumarate--CoA ligase 1-like [Eufriesea mexicana]